MSHETQFAVVPTFPLGYDVVRPGTTGETIFPLGQTGLVTYTTIPQPGHYWALDEGDAATRVDTAGALDLSGGALAATGMHNGAAEIQRNYGTALQLSLGGSTLLQGATSFGISTWVYFESAANSAYLFTPGVQVAYLRKSGAKLAIRAYSGWGSLADAISSQDAAADAWIHLFAALYDGSLRLWMDGVEATPVAFAGPVATQTGQILAMYADSSASVERHHLVDETAVWTDLDDIADAAALATMAADLYNSGAGRFWTPAGGWEAP